MGYFLPASTQYSLALTCQKVLSDEKETHSPEIDEAKHSELSTAKHWRDPVSAGSILGWLLGFPVNIPNLQAISQCSVNQTGFSFAFPSFANTFRAHYHWLNDSEM